MNNRLIKSNDAGGGGGCTNTVDLYNPFPDGGGVALYQLNGDATDVSGNYDGTTVTDVTWGGAGQFGTSGSFNGSSSRIAIPNIVNQAADHTTSIWIKPTDFNANRGALSMFNGSHLLVYITTDAGLNSQGATSGAGSTAGTLTANVWNHIVLTYNYATTTYTMYVNGVNRGVDVNFNFSGRTNSIGCHNGGPSFGAFFNGSIDQVRIFNRALRPYEVEALYTEEYCTPTIVPSEHFNTVLYTGTGPTPQSISGVGFQPDFVWGKLRSSAGGHFQHDSVRGATKFLQSNTTNAEGTTTTGLNAFTSDGFQLGTDNGTWNSNGDTFVAWNFKAGGAAVTNTDGTITSQVSANTEAGFSIVSYTGNGTQPSTIGHGLGSAPKIVINKCRSLGGTNWHVYSSDLGATSALVLNDTAAAYTGVAEWGSDPSSSVLYVNNTNTNNSGRTYVSYCFAEVEGFSSFGSYVGTYTGTGAVPDNTIITGFEPAFVMIKAASRTEWWTMYDNKRNIENPRNSVLFANESIAELTDTNYDVEFLKNGFNVKSIQNFANQSGETYIYMAFAADPTAVEPTLEDSFNTVTYTGNGGTQTIGGVFEGGGSFNGSSSRISSDIPMGVDHSVSMWIKFDSISSAQKEFLDWSDTSTGRTLRLNTYNSNQIRFATDVDQFYYDGVTTDVWYHLVYSGDGKCFVNKSLVATLAEDTSTTGDYFYLGSNHDLNRFSDCSIDQVRIFNTALTAAQVTELYEETDADSSVCDFPSGAGGIALYELNGNANDTCGTYNGTATSVTWLNNGVGFQPDLVWVKNRQSPPILTFNLLFDSVRGATKWLSSNATNAEGTIASSLTSFDSNGFSLGTDPVSGNEGWNINGNEHVAWCWKGAEIPAINSNGSIPSVVSANPAAGFSIVSYTGSGANANIGHGLGVVPSMIIVKNRDNGAQLWSVYHASTGAGQVAHLNTTAAFSASGDWQNTTPDSNVYYTNNSPRTNELNKKIIAYCFAEVAGFSKFGSFSNIGSGTLDFGFEPAFVMVKTTDVADNWRIYDNKRDTVGINNKELYANLSNAEYTSTNFATFTSTGLDFSGGNTFFQTNSFIYMAFANQF